MALPASSLFKGLVQRALGAFNFDNQSVDVAARMDS